MTTPLVLHGYQHSVYTWIVRMTLAHAGVPYQTVEVSPFVGDTGAMPHPFGRVPVLMHGDFTLFETAAISGYIDRTFAHGALTPHAAKARARMDQVISILDNYGYVAMVRQVFAHDVFRPWAGEHSDPEQIRLGIDAARPVLAALDTIAQEGLVLSTQSGLTHADVHLAPMMDYFTQSSAGQTALEQAPALARWWDRCAQTPALVDTRPIRTAQTP